jgi:hypothetical protein
LELARTELGEPTKVSSGAGNSGVGAVFIGPKLLANAWRTVLTKKTPLELPTNWLSSLELAVREPISDVLGSRSRDCIMKWHGDRLRIEYQIIPQETW